MKGMSSICKVNYAFEANQIAYIKVRYRFRFSGFIHFAYQVYKLPVPQTTSDKMDT